MPKKDKFVLDEDRQRQYDAVRPAARGLLVTTVRVTGKMMWSMIKFAFRLPGMIMRAGSKDRPARPN